MNKLSCGVAKFYKKVHSLKSKSSRSEKQFQNNEMTSIQNNQEYKHEEINIDHILFPYEDVDLFLDTEETQCIM